MSDSDNLSAGSSPNTLQQAMIFTLLMLVFGAIFGYIRGLFEENSNPWQSAFAIAWQFAILFAVIGIIGMGIYKTMTALSLPTWLVTMVMMGVMIGVIGVGSAYIFQRWEQSWLRTLGGSFVQGAIVGGAIFFVQSRQRQRLRSPK